MRDREQVDLFRDLADVWMKIIITGIILLIYSSVMVILIILIFSEHPWQNTAILAFVEALLTMVIPTMARHFFPKRDLQE